MRLWKGEGLCEKGHKGEVWEDEVRVGGDPPGCFIRHFVLGAWDGEALEWGCLGTMHTKS